MIDWSYVAVHSLWIVGASILLAAFSWHDWVARRTRRPRREVMREAVSWQLSRSGACLLIAVSQACMTHRAAWHRILWWLLAAWFAWELLCTLMQRRRDVALATGGAHAAREDAAVSAGRPASS
jgi:hypothetical protein